MMFRPELCELILSGRKTVTRRPVSDNPRSPWGGSGLTPGRTYAVQPGRGKPAVARILLEDARVERLGWITMEDAVREGFDGVAGFVSYWEVLYGDFNSSQVVWRLEFRLEAAA